VAESKFWKPCEPDELKSPVVMKFGEILNQKQLYSLLKNEKSRRVNTESRPDPVCVGLYDDNLKPDALRNCAVNLFAVCDL
jgi:hypothetical protein